MYPNLYFAFKDLFGVEWNFLRFVNSFGFFVAIAFILAAVVITAELKRKSREGLFQPTEMQMLVGQPATASELILNFLLGIKFWVYLKWMLRQQKILRLIYFPE